MDWSQHLRKRWKITCGLWVNASFTVEKGGSHCHTAAVKCSWGAGRKRIQADKLAALVSLTSGYHPVISKILKWIKINGETIPDVGPLSLPVHHWMLSNLVTLQCKVILLLQWSSTLHQDSHLKMTHLVLQEVTNHGVEIPLVILLEKFKGLYIPIKYFQKELKDFIFLKIKLVP